MLGNSAIAASAFGDLGSGELLFVATGVAGTGALGTGSVTGNQSGLTVGSLVATTALNGVTVDAGATIEVNEPTNLIGAVGTAVASAGAIVPVTGVEGTGELDAVTVINITIASPTGVEAEGEFESVTITGDAVFAVTTAGIFTASVDSVVAVGGAGAAVTGVSITGTVNPTHIDTVSSVTVVPTGVSATGRVGQATIWGTITPNPGSIWSPIAA